MPESLAVGCEGHSGDDGDVDGLVVGDGRSDGFEDVERTRGAQVVASRVSHEFHVGVADNPWQQHRLALLPQPVDEIVRVDLPLHGVIQ